MLLPVILLGLFVAALGSLIGTVASAQEPAPVYEAEKRYSFDFKADALLREEWTRDIFVSSGPFINQSRFRGRLLPRVEIGLGKLFLGVGGDFNYSTDDNTNPKPSTIRDNYKSRDARVDLAFASLKPVSWLQLQAGRFAMPVGFTEMIWDRDLRPQGAALTLAAHDKGPFTRLGVTVLGASGSHVFDDGGVNMLVTSGGATIATGDSSQLELTGSFVTWTNINSMEPMIRRQNTRVRGQFVHDYRVVDVVGRLRFTGSLAAQLVADVCWNTAVDEDRRGIWLAAVLGSLQSSRVRGEYTYVRVDTDATLAAYGADDFLWVTGWEGHRSDLGFGFGDHASLHGIGQLQRYYDSPRVPERDHWVKRFRLELRVHI